MHLRCKRQRNTWISLVRKHSVPQKYQENIPNAPVTNEETDSETHCTGREDELDTNLPATDVPSIIFPCINDALLWLSCGQNPDISGELLSPPAFPPPQALQEAAQIQASVFLTYHCFYVK